MRLAPLAQSSHLDARRFGLLRRTSPGVLALPGILLLVIAFVVPVLLVLAISVREPQPGFSNYAILLESAAVQSVLWRTFRIAAVVTLLATAGGYLIAFAMVNASSRWQTVLLIVVLIPLWSSVLIRSFAWVTLLRSNGLINQGLEWLGVIDSPLALVRNELGVVIGMTHVMLPLATLPIYAVMRSLDGRLLQAARSLGASAKHAFATVFLPLSAPGIIAGATLVFVNAIGFYITPAVLGGGRVLMAAEYIEVQISSTLRWGLGTMVATVLLATVVCLFALGTMLAKRRPGGARGPA
jgi:putative spermidine/putrescine transport system permease protein